MKVLIVDVVHPTLKLGLENLGFEVVEDFESKRETILQKMHLFDGLVIRSRFPIDAYFLEQAQHLKFIGRVGAGMENIDIDAATSFGIKLFSAPEGNRDAVGEHALAMLLMLLNNLRMADAEVRRGIWKREENRGYELGGKTVGIIGFGNMGQAFAKKIRGFDVEVLAYDKYTMTYEDWDSKEATLNDILEKADVVSFHVPQTTETHYYFDEDFVDKMKKPFYLINTARGKVVKTEALVKGLQTGKVLGACLDVLEYEKSSFENMFIEANLPADFQYLINSDKVILSPHIAGWTHESNQKMAEIIVEKIKQGLAL